MASYLCDTCGTVGTEDDGISGHGDDCPDEECGGTIIDTGLQAVEDQARLLRGMSDGVDNASIQKALLAGSVALEGLAIAYRANELWTVDGSDGSDDAAMLYAILTDIGLEVP